MLRYFVFALPAAFALLALTVTALPTNTAGGDICCQGDLVNYTVLSENGTQSGGKSIRTSFNANVNVDFLNTRYSSKGYMMEDGNAFNFWVITKSGKSIAINEATKSCSETALIWYPRFCVPSTAQKVGSFAYGPVGQTFQTDAYKFQYGTSDYLVTVTSDCTLINLVHGVSSPLGGSLTSSILTNFRASVDESAFELPSYCKESFDSSVVVG